MLDALLLTVVVGFSAKSLPFSSFNQVKVRFHGLFKGRTDSLDISHSFRMRDPQEQVAVTLNRWGGLRVLASERKPQFVSSMDLHRGGEAKRNLFPILYPFGGSRRGG